MALAVDGRKVCSRCGAEKDVAAFCRRTRSSDGLQYYCRECSSVGNRRWYSASGRDNHLRKRYGMSQEHFDRMLARQEGRCAGCQQPFGDEQPVVDHDHATGQVRSLLHSNCNTILGLARETHTPLYGLAVYLETHCGR